MIKNKYLLPFVLLPMFFLPNFSFADDSNYLSSVEKQVGSVISYCSGKTLGDDRVNLVRNGFANIKNGVFNGELPSDYKKFADKFYKDSDVGDFYFKKDGDGFLLIIIDGENTCNSIPLYTKKASSDFLSSEDRKGKVSEHDSVGTSGEKIKSLVYKIKENIFVLSEIKNKDIEDGYSMVTAVRVY